MSWHVSGENFMRICDLVVYRRYDLEVHPNLKSNCKRSICIEDSKDEYISIITEINKMSSVKIFVKSNILTFFINDILPLLNTYFVLVTHNSDYRITNSVETRTIIDNNYLVKWYGQNMTFEHDKVVGIPIGVANSQYPGSSINDIVNNIGKEKLLYCNFNPNTNVERAKVKESLINNGFTFAESKPWIEYIEDLASHKFVISPPGYGVDCHRTWESLYAGSIPIIKSDPVMRFFDHLPIVYVESFDEITVDFLENLDLRLEHLPNELYISWWEYQMNLDLGVNLSPINTYSAVDNNKKSLDYKLFNILNKEFGFYIELGANNGLFQSNTAMLEFDFHWTGILIEPSVNAYEECLKNRPNSICLNCACVSDDYLDETVIGDFDGNPMSSIGGERLSRDLSNVTKSTTLNKILSKFKPTVIDFLSLDTEGYEYEILKGLDLNRFRPKYMLIELYQHNINEILEHLLHHNYVMIANFSNYNLEDNPQWGGNHNDYLFKDIS